MTAEERISRFRGDTGIDPPTGRALEMLIEEAESDARREALEEAAQAVEAGLAFHSYAGTSAAGIVRALAASPREGA